jgi:hypothetical protein
LRLSGVGGDGDVGAKIRFARRAGAAIHRDVNARIAAQEVADSWGDPECGKAVRRCDRDAAFIAAIASAHGGFDVVGHALHGACSIEQV